MATPYLSQLEPLTRRLSLPRLFVLVAVVFGLIFGFSTPLLWGPDETSHFGRVYQLSEGHLTAKFLGTTASTGYGGYVPKNVLTYIEVTGKHLGSLPTKNPESIAQYNGDKSTEVSLGKQKLSKQQALLSFPTAAGYSFVAYFPALIGVKVGHLLNLNLAQIVWLGRLASLAFYITCVYFALKSLSFSRAKWIFFVVALLPTALSQATIITADTVTNALALLFSALFIKAALYRKQLSKTEALAIILCVLLLPLVKPTYVFLALLILLVPNDRLRTLRWPSWIKPLAIVLGIGGFLFWLHLTPGIANATGTMNPAMTDTINPHKQVVWMAKHIFSAIFVLGRTLVLKDSTYFNQLIGYIGFNGVYIPAVAFVASLTALGLSVLLMDAWKFTKRTYFTVLALTIIGVISIFETLYLTFTSVAYPVIVGIQGRYFVPFTPLLLMCLMPITKFIKLDIRSEKSYRAAASIICGLVIISLTLSSFKWIYTVWG